MPDEHDPYLEQPKLCPVHGEELDGDYCESCWLQDYEDRLREEGDLTDAEEDRGHSYEQETRT